MPIRSHSMAALTQLRLLLWKSAKVAWRSPFYTILEILLPLIVLNILRLVRKHAPPAIIDHASATKGRILEFSYADSITYSCEYDQCASINRSLSGMCDKFQCEPNYKQDDDFYSVFHINSFNQTSLDIVNFMPKIFMDSFVQTASSSDYLPQTQWRVKDMEQMIGSFARFASNLSSPIVFKSLSSPKNMSWTSYPLLHYPLVLFAMTLVPVLAAINVAREIAVEKESSMKDYLLVMGMTRLTYYTHHLLWALIKSLPAIVGVSAMIIYDEIFLGFHFLVAFTLFVAAEISLAMLIPTFIKRPTIATLFAFVIIPFNALIGVTIPVPRSSILLSALVALNPGHAMALAFDTLREAVIRGKLIYISEINYAVTYGAIIVIMIFDIVLYLSIAILIDLIGSSTENLCAMFKRAVTIEDDDDEFDLNVHEVDPSLSNAVVDVELTDVHKTYPSGERAVRGVSMKLLRGQVTVLLGHNGAGKSTTFAMIAGITVPTKGSIRIGEVSSKNDTRSSIGYCPQYNPIFPKLTVSEHLSFFAALKGLSTEAEYKAEGKRLMELLLLKEKKKERAAALSGGMKRKLSIAISLIGNSKVVLLDEPTAGVDAGARRDIEKLLVAQKKERTFLLTTHYTDEAEHLGDRIMIMAGGKLVCSGSPHFLNREFGAGYILSCVAKDSKLLQETAEATLNLAEEHIGAVKLERQHGHQFEIWLDKGRSERFPDLFRALESEKDELGIESYGLSNNTLEQVFLRVGELTGVARQAKVKEALGVLLKENENRSTGPCTYLKRFMYLQYKRLLYEFCELRSVLINLLPIFLFIYSIASTMKMIEKAATQSFEEVIEYNEQSFDALKLPYCMRLGVNSQLNISTALRKSFPKGSCILVEQTSNTTAWYESTAMTRRPPILGTVDGSVKDGLLVSMAPNALLSSSALNVALIRALTNTPFSVNAQYKHFRPPNRRSRYMERRESREPDVHELRVSMTIAVAIFMFVQPILMYRSIGFYVVERTIKFTHQQLLTGLPRWLYWLDSFVSDLAMFLLNFGFAVGCCIYFDVLADELWRLTPLCLLIFCISQFKCYILQRVFSSKSKAENLAVILLIVSYIALSTVYSFNAATSMMKQQKENVDDFNPYYDWPLLIDPHVAVVFHFSRLALAEDKSVYGALFIQLASVLIVFIVMEFGPTLLQVYKRRRTQSVQDSGSAPLLEDGNSKLVLEVNNLVKAYGGTVAVKGISFGVEQHECFGLLGVNGAGKTSTFEVLTGSSTATSGSATVAGVDCSTPAKIGYCPQFDALMQELSGRENLVILAALHGYRNPGLVADTVSECVGMGAHANKRSKSYSGGQRRKISVATALLAQNSLIILDEPTAGIDPVTRRDIWSVICALRDATETAIVLTSHSMEEVEALCSRIAILRTGEIAAQGSSQALKSAYGNNFKLTLVVEGKDAEVVKEAVRTSFKNARRINISSESVFTFEIPRNPSASWSAMFSRAIDLARELQARDFCLSQASLEDAFIALTSGAEAINHSENGVNAV